MLLIFRLNSTLNVTFIILPYAPVAQYENSSLFLAIWSFENTFSLKNKKACFNNIPIFISNMSGEIYEIEKLVLSFQLRMCFSEVVFKTFIMYQQNLSIHFTFIFTRFSSVIKFKVVET